MNQIAVEPQRPKVSLSRVQAAQHARLAIGVGGLAGGAVLLSSNLMYLILSGATALPWTPLLANAALIFGGAMFLRERRRHQSLLDRIKAPEPR